VAFILPVRVMEVFKQRHADNRSADRSGRNSTRIAATT
jgi:hypothetical protein